MNGPSRIKHSGLELKTTISNSKTNCESWWGDGCHRNQFQRNLRRNMKREKIQGRFDSLSAVGPIEKMLNSRYILAWREASMPQGTFWRMWSHEYNCWRFCIGIVLEWLRDRNSDDEKKRLGMIIWLLNWVNSTHQRVHGFSALIYFRDFCDPNYFWEEKRHPLPSDRGVK